MIRATCKLCLKEADLHDSHILPAWSYKRAREPGTKNGNPNPVVVRDGVVFQSSKQDSEHMLCRDCEERMKPGEDYVHAISYQRDHSERFTSLVGNVTGAGADGVRVALPGQLDHKLLAYYGASVLWRGSVARCLPACSLGAKYEELFRRYLMAQAPFPACAGCILTFYDLPTNAGGYVGSICFTPASDRQDGYHAHRFIIFGLEFYFAVGSRLPAWCETVCFARSEDHHIMLAPQELLLQGPGRWMAEARVSAKLARRPP